MKQTSCGIEKLFVAFPAMDRRHRVDMRQVVIQAAWSWKVYSL